MTESQPPDQSISHLGDRLQPLLPEGLVLEFSGGAADSDLLAEEAAATASWAAHRRAQFAMGRACARRGLRRLGYDPVAILFDDEGAPLWPRDVVGSISHKRQDCIVAVASSATFRSIGVDLERDAGDSAEAELVRRVCTTDGERSQVRMLEATTRSPGTLFLAAKEAFFKFQFPITRARLDWDDVEVTFAANTFTTGQTSGGMAPNEGVYLVADGWIVALIAERQAYTGRAFPVSFVALAPGVVHVRGAFHHSLLIEMNDHLVLVDTPLDEGRSAAVLAAIRERYPKKPVKRIVETHFHYDHIGGIRYFAAEPDVTLLVAEPSVRFYRGLFSRPHTVQPDRYEEAQRPSVAIIGVDTTHTISAAEGREIQLLRVPTVHADDMLVAYLPAEKVIFVADLYAPSERTPSEPTPSEGTREFYDALVVQNLDATKVAKIVGAHGDGVSNFADLKAAAAR